MTRGITVAVLLSLVTLSSTGTCKGEAQTARTTMEMVGPWQLFIDDYLISARKNVVRRYHPFEKYPANPLIVVDKPWEAHVVAACTVLPDEQGSGFRMYYYCWTENKDEKKGRGSFLCYAISKDGLKWEKPDLGLY
ncbi:MAG TPA: hypothetical protein PKV86_07315, partial [Syntrophobacteraceae bacterium]|nr:hypothetical protein [Syntrophobacteraceae bacterium]